MYGRADDEASISSFNGALRRVTPCAWIAIQTRLENAPTKVSRRASVTKFEKSIPHAFRGTRGDAMECNKQDNETGINRKSYNLRCSFYREGSDESIKVRVLGPDGSVGVVWHVGCFEIA